MRNPLSAIISSPGRIRSKNPQSLVMNLSDTFPPHNFKTYVMSPDGEIHTRALKVLCCLYELHVWDWAVGFLGFFIKKTSYSQLCLLHLGNSVGTIQAEIVLLHSEMAIKSGVNITAMQVIHVVNICDTLDSKYIPQKKCC